MTNRHRSLFCASMVAIMAGSLAGCPDPNARSEAEASVELRHALASIDVAGKGYVPRERTTAYFGEEQGESFAELSRQYRLENLADASERLQVVVDKGTPEAKVGAHRLIADIKSAHARNLTSQAMIDYSKLSNRGANMITQALLVSQAEARGEMFQNDEQYLREQLALQKAGVQEKVSELQKQAAQFKKNIADLESRISKLNDERDAATGQAEKQREAAFQQVSDAQYESSLAAIKSQRVADAAAAKAEQLGIELDVEKSRLAMAEREAQLLQTDIAQIDSEVEAVGQREAQRVTRVRESGEAVKANAATLQSLFNATLTEQASLVDDRFETAIGLFKEAATHLTTAQEIAASNKVSAQNTLAVKVDLLSTLVGLTRAQYQYAMVTGGYGETLNAMGAFYRGSINSQENVDTYRSEAERVVSKQAALIQEIRATIAQGAAVVAELRSSSTLPDETTRVVTAQAQRLDIYAGRLDPVTIGSAATFPDEIYASPEPVIEEPAPAAGEGEVPADGEAGIPAEAAPMPTGDGGVFDDAPAPATDADAAPAPVFDDAAPTDAAPAEEPMVEDGAEPQPLPAAEETYEEPME